MKVANTFEKGLSTEFAKLKQPKGTYPFAQNIVRDAQATIKSEPGTKLLASLPELSNAKVIGRTTVEDEIFYFIKSSEGSTIVRLNKDNTITLIMHTGTGYVSPVVEQRYRVGIFGSGDPSTLNFAAPGSAIYDVVLKLSDINEATITWEYVSGGTNGDPVAVSTNFSSSLTSDIIIPEALRPTSSVTMQNDTEGGGTFNLLLRSSDNLVQFYQSGSSGTREFSIDSPITYQCKGVTSNIIPTDSLGFSYSSPIEVVGRKNAKGEVILYFTDGETTPKRINTSNYIDAQNFDSQSTLFLAPSLPRVTNLEVLESGGLTTGLYSFAARLGTATGNTTTFSQISGSIPIVDENQAVGEIGYDGAPPQTPGGKAIRITLDNIDTSYDFIEIAVITYEGTENLTKAYVINKRSVTNSSITFDYYSNSQNLEEVLLESLIEESIEYNTAQHILQKDNHLFFANLTTTNNSVIDEKMQDIANNIEIHWYEKSFINTNFNQLLCETQRKTADPVDWSVNGDYITFDDVNTYSFRLKPNTGGSFLNYKNPDLTYRYKGYQRDEVYSFAIVPIFKGGIHGTAYHIPGDANNISTRTNPGNDTGTRLRGWLNVDGTIHHRMPSLQTSKPYFRDNTFGYETLKVLGVTLKNVDLQSDPLLADKLEGYAIVRQRRNKPGNGIVPMQGIAKPFYKAVSNGLQPGPFMGKTIHRRRLQQLPAGDLEDSGPNKFNYGVADKYFLFYSPDQEHGVISEDYLSGLNEIEMVTLRVMQRYCDNRTTDMSTTNESIGAFYQTVRDVSTDNSYDITKLRQKQTLDSAIKRVIYPFESTEPNSISMPDGKSIQTLGMMGGVVLGTSTGKLNREYQKFGYYTSEVVTYQLIPGENFRYSVNSVNESLEIYNTYAYSENVYGDLQSAEYILAEERYFDQNPGSEINVFGGDTFLSNYMFTIGERSLKPYNRTVGLSFRANVQTYIETRGNYEYRHWVPEETIGDTTIEGTVPYFPKYPELMNYDPTTTGVLGIWDYPLDKGAPIQYNKHYHFENTLNKYYPTDSFLDVVTNFPNRVVYSLQAFENEQFDSYRVFLTNNYHDIPKETGEITNIFEFNNGLFIHTPHSLWRAFVNEKTFTNTSTGDIVLGNGGLFPVPSQQLYTQQGGFAGSESKFASINTPYGRVFIDDHQKKVFIMGAKGELNEISNPLMTKWFNDNLVVERALTYRAGYDPLHKRLILTLSTTDAIEPGYSISYSFENKSWSSFHTHGAEFYAERDNKLLSTLGGSFYEMGTGDYNDFYGGTQESRLTLVVNEAYTQTKDFINLKWIQEYKDKVFDTIRVYTENYDTGIVFPELVTSFQSEQKFLPLGQQHVHSVGGEFRMTVPPDNNPEASYVDDLFRPSIKGKYGVIELSFTPEITLKNPLELQHIETEYLNVAE